MDLNAGARAGRGSGRWAEKAEEGGEELTEGWAVGWLVGSLTRPICCGSSGGPSVVLRLEDCAQASRGSCELVCGLSTDCGVNPGPTDISELKLGRATTTGCPSRQELDQVVGQVDRHHSS